MALHHVGVTGRVPSKALEKRVGVRRGVVYLVSAALPPGEMRPGTRKRLSGGCIGVVNVLPC